MRAYPIDNPAPLPKQPFSRQNYVGTLGGPIMKDKFGFSHHLRYVHEDASIAYSPASLTQFNALAALAAQGLIPGINSIPVPNNVPVPFQRLSGRHSLRLGAVAALQWFLRAALDNYMTENDLVQQATLPSTGATSHSNYMNLVLSQQFHLQPDLAGYR